MSSKENDLVRSPNRFRQVFNVAALKITDLLEARDLHHVLIANLPNVVGTAIGLFRIRRTDPDAEKVDGKWKRKRRAGPRTLANTVVRPWSWPCVLVFVDKWNSVHDLASKPEEIVPPWLYLPDGSRVPVCTVLAPPQHRPTYEANRLTFPTGMYGGGFPVLTAEQGSERVGTIACLATNGHDVFALTNRHVAGEAGTVAYTVERGERRRIGAAVQCSAGKIGLKELYPGWAGKRISVNLDAGLFKVDAMSEWTSQVYGIGRIGTPVNLGVDTMTLGLVGCPVRAFGAVSGAMTGEIQALFYRYRSVAGFDCVADLLIGPRDKEARVETQPGDSGTLWFYDEEVDKKKSGEAKEEPRRAIDSARAPDVDTSAVRTALLQPLAMQWGGSSFLAPGSQQDTRFVLASTISNVCRILDVDLLTDWSIEHSQYWGKVGHYKIGYSACFHVSKSFPKLRALLSANATNISVSDQDIEKGQMPKATERDKFSALADVPDLVWRTTRKKDAANHFADMDQKAPPDGTYKYKGRTLLDLWFKQPATRTPKEWDEFYDSFDNPKVQVKHRGALPFRVKELFEEMVEHLKNDSLPKFVCVAGVLAHYVGDACQPLHVSHLHHGHDPGEKDVHAVYETKMLDRYAAEFIQLLNAKLAGRVAKSGILTGADAAHATVELMRLTIKTLSPERVIDVFNEVRGRGQIKNMWEKLKTPTISVTAEGVLTLTGIWQGAWKASKSETRFSKAKAAKRILPATLRGLYNNPAIAKSNWLRDM